MEKLERIVSGGGRRFLLRVEDSHEAADYRKYEDIRNDVWGFPDDHLAGTRNMMCENFLAEGASLFIGAFAEAASGGFPLDGEYLAGFCYGFVGILDKAAAFRDPANLRFYSQFAGVRPGFQAHGLGILMKEFQRDVVRGTLGVGTIICTFDPLTGVNAHRNVHHFGMTVEEYRVATYGEYGGLLNRADVPTDRFLMTWDLAKPPGPSESDTSKLPAGERILDVQVRRVAGRDGDIELECVRAVRVGVSGDAALVQIPLDFYRMLRQTDLADPAVRRIPVDWRLRTREAFLGLFERGYRVTDFLRAAPARAGNFYFLTRND